MAKLKTPEELLQTLQAMTSEQVHAAQLSALDHMQMIGLARGAIAEELGGYRVQEASSHPVGKPFAVNGPGIVRNTLFFASEHEAGEAARAFARAFDAGGAARAAAITNLLRPR